MTDRVPLFNAGVRFPPPFLFVIGFLVGWVLDRYWHALPLSRFAGSALEPFGWSALAVGLILIGWGMVTFRRAKTAIHPHHSASQLVTHGPYRFTGNPMYTGLTIAYLGGVPDRPAADSSSYPGQYGHLTRGDVPEGRVWLRVHRVHRERPPLALRE